MTLFMNWPLKIMALVMNEPIIMVFVYKWAHLKTMAFLIDGPI